MRICLIGDSQDLSFTYISWLAQKRGLEVLELAEDLLGMEWSFAYSDTDMSNGYIEKLENRYPFSSFCGAFVRLHPEPGVPSSLSLPPDETAVLVVERRHALQHLLNSLPFSVANHPSAGRSNGSKPYQMNLLAREGFSIPRWMATNQAGAVREFLRQCQGKAIYKACSGLRSKVRLVSDELLERLEQGSTPVIVQEYIKGYDVRVHVVANQIFATKIVSHGIDYRFETEDNKFQETSVPDRIKEMCIRFAQSERLTVAGLDFRVTEQEEWYCLESNPVPTFLPYEMSTGQPIGGAILDFFLRN